MPHPQSPAAASCARVRSLHCSPWLLAPTWPPSLARDRCCGGARRRWLTGCRRRRSPTARSSASSSTLTASPTSAC
eukprot:4280468-Prymnesium_polylepis.1